MSGNQIVAAAMEQLRSGEGDVEGVMLVDDGGVIVIAARGELAGELLEVTDERIRHATRTREKKR